jgi:hypothetical protein
MVLNIDSLWKSLLSSSFSIELVFGQFEGGRQEAFAVRCAFWPLCCYGYWRR